MSKASTSNNRTGRKIGQKVKKTKLKASSRRWLERHINDPYVQRARLEGYRARAAFKLLEINDWPMTRHVGFYWRESSGRTRHYQVLAEEGDSAARLLEIAMSN